MSKTRRKLRYAVVGLGYFAQAAVLPAFANATDNSELAALFTGDPDKARELADKYSVPAYHYDEYDARLADGGLDAVYIALPNSHHRPYTERAARAGVHVLCEKPMAGSAADCQAMIDACAAAGVKLMIAYRLHFEEGNLKAAELVHSGRLGQPRLFSSVFTQQVREGNTRLDADLDGGPLEDIGIYCINAARYLFRAEPTEAFAYATWPADARFGEVPDLVAATLRFDGDRLAQFTCGFGEAKVGNYRVVGTEGELFMGPAYTWNGDIRQVVTVGEDEEEETFEKRDQVGPEIVYFSDCVLTGREPEPSGVEGLIDVRIIEALRQSHEEGRPVKLGPLPAKARPGLRQNIERPEVAEDDLVKAAPPGK